MELTEARYLAEKVVHKLVPVTERAQICGSIRRHRSDVHDIDICCIPKRRPIKDLFGNTARWMPIVEFCDVIDSWEKLKGEATGKYTQRFIEGVKVEISICDTSTFPIISLIRTGNADFTHLLMKCVLKRGLTQKDGLLYNGEKLISIRNEKEYFDVLGLPYIEPINRDINAFKVILK